VFLSTGYVFGRGAVEQEVAIIIAIYGGSAIMVRDG
jgi:hypothetical protein